jgi:hypothetical protein
MHQTRSEVLGLVAQLEDKVDLVLALHLGRDIETFWTLYTDVMPRLGWQERMTMFKRLLESTTAPRRSRHRGALTFAQSRPLLLPLLQELVDSRHTLAHALVMPAEDDDKIRLRRRRKGSIDLVAYRISRLKHLTGEAAGLLWTLDELEPHVGDLEVWGSIYGFDEGIDEN